MTCNADVTLPFVQCPMQQCHTKFTTPTRHMEDNRHMEDTGHMENTMQQ